MSFVGLFGKRTWLGLASAVAALLLCVMLGALLVVKGVLPSGMTVWWVYGSCGLAAFLGGCMARKGGGEAVDFQSHGLWITGAVFGGGFLACVLCRGKKRKKQAKRQAPAAVKRRRRAVT